MGNSGCFQECTRIDQEKSSVLADLETKRAAEAERLAHENQPKEGETADKEQNQDDDQNEKQEVDGPVVQEGDHDNSQQVDQILCCIKQMQPVMIRNRQFYQT